MKAISPPQAARAPRCLSDSSFKGISQAVPMVMRTPPLTPRSFGADHVIWGTDCIWWGSPQWLIEAFRRFQIPDELVEGYGSPTTPHPAVVAANPIGKIPCLVLDDGTVLYDSRVITRFLDHRFGLGLYPTDGRAWATLTLEAHADGILDAAVLCVYESRCREPAIRSAAWLEGQQAKITRGLDALEAHWLHAR